MRYEHEPSSQQQAIIEEPRLDIPLKVVAGAGTGKTFVLAHRFVWLVVSGQVSDPARILTLTFTDNAAAEMRMRIKRLLRLNGCVASGDLWIHTFHSFAARLISECSYEAGLPPQPELLTEIRQTVELENLLDGILAGDFSHIRILEPQRLAQLGFDRSGQLRDLLRSLIQRAKRYGLTPQQFRQEAQEAAQDFWEAMLPPDDAWTLGDDRAIPRQVQSRLEAAIEDSAIKDAPMEEADATRDLRKLYYEDLRRPTPRSGAADMFAQQRHIEESLIDAAVAAYQLYQQRLTEADMIDFADQIMTAVRLLRDPRLNLADRYRQQFDYILVDEFQDTSPAQMFMLQALAHPTRVTVSRNGQTRSVSTYRRLMVVGDQKQAIYAWRNARPENMDRLLPFDEHDTIEGSQVFRPLTGTFRLDRKLTDCANRAAARVRPQDPPLDSVSSESGQVVRVVPFVAEEDETARHARRRQAAYIAERIQQLVLKQEQFQYKDIGVLMRRRSEFRHLKKAFEDRQIPYQAQGGVGFFDHPLARDVLAYLHVITNPFADQYLIRLLTCPPICLNDRQLFLLATAPQESTTGSASHRRRTQPLITSLRELVQGNDQWRPPAEREELPIKPLRQLLSVITNLRRRRLLEPARTILELILQQLPTEGLTAAERASAPSVKATLQAIIQELSTEGRPADTASLLDALQLYQDRDTLRLPTADTPAYNAVQVMTIHQAKGLEFGAVFVMAWVLRPRPPIYDENWGLLQYPTTGDAQAKRTCYKLFGGSGNEDDPEEARLWYVAITRAQHLLEVTFATGSSAEDIPRADDLQTAVAQDGLTLAGEETAGTGYSHIAPLLPRRLPSEVQMARPTPFITTSFTALHNLLECPLRWWIAAQWRPDEAFAHPGQDNARIAVGTCFHSYVAAHYQAGKPLDEGQQERLIQAVMGEADPAAIDRVTRLMAAFAASAWARLHPGGENVERPIHLIREVDGAIIDISGLVDLLLADRGQFIDFKTNRHLDQSDLDTYALQMYIYQQALLSEHSGPSSLQPVIVHVTESGLKEIPLSESAIAAQEPYLEQALTQLVQYQSTAQRPAPALQPPCEGCPFASICPDRPPFTER